MATNDQTVFISYRRSTSQHLARSIFMGLRAKGYDVFLDVNSIDSGAFDRIILSQIAARMHFLLILSPGSMERCANTGDWLRREIEEAMRLQRNIVPIMEDGFEMKREFAFLPPAMGEQLGRWNGLRLFHDYFDDAIEKLDTRFLKPPAFLVSITPTPVQDHAEVQQRIYQAISQITPPPPAPPAPSPVAQLAQEDARYTVVDWQNRRLNPRLPASTPASELVEWLREDFKLPAGNYFLMNGKSNQRIAPQQTLTDVGLKEGGIILLRQEQPAPAYVPPPAAPAYSPPAVMPQYQAQSARSFPLVYLFAIVGVIGLALVFIYLQFLRGDDEGGNGNNGEQGDRASNVELPQHYSSDTAYLSFDYPSGWSVNENDAEQEIYLTSSDNLLDEDSIPTVTDLGPDDIVIFFLPSHSGKTDSEDIFSPLDTPRANMQLIAATTQGETNSNFTLGSISDITIGGHVAAYAEGQIIEETASGDTMYAFIDMDSAGYVLVFAVTAPNYAAHYKETFLNILETLTYTPPTGSGGYNQGSIVPLERGFMPDPLIIPVTAGGSNTLNVIDSASGDACVGYINQSSPTLRLYIPSGQSLRDLRIFFHNLEDTNTSLIIIHQPDTGGELQYFCNDDFESLDPLVQFYYPDEGNYAVYVGVKDQSGFFTSGTLYITEWASYSPVRLP